MSKYIYVRVYFDPTGKTGLANIYASDPAVLEWLYSRIKQQIPACKINWESCDLVGVRSEFQLGDLDNKEQQLMNWVVRMLCESGYEPYAHDEKYMHFRQIAR